MWTPHTINSALRQQCPYHTQLSGRFFPKTWMRFRKDFNTVNSLSFRYLLECSYHPAQHPAQHPGQHSPHILSRKLCSGPWVDVSYNWVPKGSRFKLCPVSGRVRGWLTVRIRTLRLDVRRWRQLRRTYRLSKSQRRIFFRTSCRAPWCFDLFFQVNIYIMHINTNF